MPCRNNSRCSANTVKLCRSRPSRDSLMNTSCPLKNTACGNFFATAGVRARAHAVGAQQQEEQAEPSELRVRRANVIGGIRGDLRQHAEMRHHRVKNSKPMRA